MKKLYVLLFFLLALSMSACAGAPEASTITTEKPFTLDQLVPTDPGTVQLAAGQVQLIEFFAYW
jgi:hypothetical protein